MRKLTLRTVCGILTAAGVLCSSFSAYAADIAKSSEYPSIGISSLIDSYCTTDSSLPRVGVTNAIEEYVKAIIDTDLVATVSQVREEYRTVVIAQVDGYLNVRKEPDTNSEVVGKLQNNSAANITGVVGDWYKITSGTVTGYVMKEYVLFGKSAEALAEQIARKTGTVKADALNIRSSASKEATVLDVMPQGDTCEVLSEEGEWTKIQYGDATGYVLTQYIDIQVSMETAESKNEEATRLASEEAAYLASIAKYSSASSSAYEAAREAATAAQRARTIAEGDPTEKTTKFASEAEHYAVLAESYADQLAEEEREAAERARQAAAEAEAARQAAAQRAAAASRSQSNSNSNSGSGSSSKKNEGSNTKSYNNAAAYSNSSKGQQIASYAQQFIGNPYVWGGTSLTNGADCSGFVQSVMANCGISVSGRTAASQSSGGYSVAESELQPGDLVFYASGGRVYHVAIYIGGGQVVHAASSSLGICTSNYRYATPYKFVRYY